MNAFSTIFKLELLLYKRSIWLWVSVVLLTGYLYLGYNAYLSINVEVGQFLQSSGYIGMASAIVGLLMGMLSARREQAEGFAETLSSIPGDSVRGIAKLAAWSVIALLITMIAALEMVALVIYVDSEFVTFWNMIVNYVFLYWGMTLLSCGYVGYALEKLFPSKWWSLPIMFAFWIVISPANYYILLLLSYLGMSDWLSVIFSYLNQGERNLEYAYRDVQGLHISFDVTMKKLFFYLLSLLLVSLVSLKQKHREKSRKEKRTIYYCSTICLILLIGVAVMAKSPLDKSVILDYETYYEEQDRIYYKEAHEIPLSDFRPFQIDAYNVVVSSHNNEIKYSVMMNISQESMRGAWLPFTLYHGLNVNKVKLNDTAVEWSRNGDTLFIKTSENMNSLQISFDVNGHTGALHPVGGNSFFLASDFPWLPVPGIYKIAGILEYNGQLSYNSIFLDEETDYNITVNSSYKVFSNLPEEKHHVFVGKAKGVSLLSGRLLEKEEQNIKITYPPDRLQNLESFLTNLQESVDQVARLLGVDSIDLKDDLEAISVVPYYSYENAYRMKYIDGQLYINEKFGRSEYRGLSEVASVFYGFFWNNEYREQNEYNSFILSTLIEFLASSDHETTLMKQLVADINRRGEESDPVQYLFKDILLAYEQGQKDEIFTFLKDMYAALMQGDLSLDDWNSKLAAELQRGASNNE